MKTAVTCICLFHLMLALAFLPSSAPAAAKPASGREGMVASAHPLATKAGLEILKSGGNAVDAAVATAFALGVVEPYASGIGGGGFMLIYLAEKKEILAIDYRETAPVRMKVSGPADRKMGAKSIATPGAVAGLAKALEDYGSKDLKEVLAPSLRLAEDGFTVSRLFVNFVEHAAAKISRFPELEKKYLKPGYREGDRFRQPDLARTYRLIAEEGPDIFYRGEIARAITAEVNRSGGWLGSEDLARYKAVLRKPVSGSYRGYEIYSMPPPSSGGVHVIELLNILEGYDLARLGYQTPLDTQLTAEAMRRVFRDKARHMGDPDFVQVPVAHLTSKEYAAGLRKNIKKGAFNRRLRMPEFEPESDQTSHISVADAKGNMVALTQTLNSFFGSGILVPGTGILLNNEMSDFSEEGPNRPEPGKKPVSSLAPTIVLRNGRAFMSVGMAGAERIISGLPQIITDAIDFGLDIQAAIDAPRYYCRSEKISMESRIAQSTREALAGMGYEIEIRSPFDLYFGGAQGVTIDPETGLMQGGADPRRQGYAEGY